MLIKLDATTVKTVIGAILGPITTPRVMVMSFASSGLTGHPAPRPTGNLHNKGTPHPGG